MLLDKKKRTQDSAYKTALFQSPFSPIFSGQIYRGV